MGAGHGLRFFTVGPWGRPDMALFLFTSDAEASIKVLIMEDGVISRM